MSEHVIHPHGDVGSKLDERTHALHVLVARAQRPPAEQTMVLDHEVRAEQSCQGGPVASRDGSTHPIRRGWRGFRRGEARVELRVGGVQLVQVEEYDFDVQAVAVDLADGQIVDGESTAPSVDATFEEGTTQRQSCATRRDRRDDEAAPRDVEQQASPCCDVVARDLHPQQSATIVQVERQPMGRGDRVPVASVPCAHEALIEARHGIGEAWIRRRGRLLGVADEGVEAGERVGIAVGVEPFGAHQQTVGSELPQEDQRPLERSARRPSRAGGRSAHEQRVGAQTENVVIVLREVLGHLETGAHAPHDGPGALNGRESEAPVVDEHDVGSEGVLRVDGLQERGDRSRGPVGASVLWPVALELGVSLVQAGDRIAEPVGEEVLAPQPPSVGVDLGHQGPLALVGADIELRALESARPHRLAEEGEPVAERRQSLVQDDRVARRHQRALGDAHAVPVVRRAAGGPVDDLRLLGPQREDGIEVARGDGGVHLGGVPGSGVRPNAARGRRRLGDPVEARERLVVAVRVELLPSAEEALRVERPDHQPGPLVGAAGGAIGAEVRPAHEQRVGTVAEDVVDAEGTVGRALEE